MAAAKPDAKPSIVPWYSKILFNFVDPVITIARREGRLDLEHVPPHTDKLGTASLFDKFNGALESRRARGKPSMVFSLMSGRWPVFAVTAVGYLITQASQLAGPLLLGRIVTGLTCRDADVRVNCDSQTTLYMYALGLFIAPLVQAFVENYNQFALETIGLYFRSSLMGAIFRKVLKLNNSSLASETAGKIVTLMSNDAQKMQEVMLMIHMVWGGPVFIAVVLVMLYRQIKWACFVGLAVMLLLAPATTLVGKRLGALRKVIVQWTDKRTTIMSEVINGIRVIKFYAWEGPFKEQVRKYRNEEAKILRTIAKLQGAFGLTLFAGPVIVSIASFAAYAAAGNTLTVAEAYTALALFTLLRLPMGFLPTIILNVVNASVALKRISAFLNNPEISEDAHYSTDAPRGSVEITDGTFSWSSEESSEPTLHDIRLSCAPGSLTMIVGSVGCGKSSLLATLFRQISRVTGHVAVGGTLSYVPQTAWIMNATVRDNVLMGLPMDETRYKSTLACAQLATDLDLLPNGDETEIGERGVTLSGGQKQRVSIARAVYADSDVVILDDPLSAVDAHVGKALFEQCLCGALKNKTVLLVTNALHFVHLADQVVWVREGRIVKSGSYQDVSSDAEFAELVGNHVVQEDVKAPGDVAVTEEEVIVDKEPEKEGKRVEATKDGNTKSQTGNEDRTTGALSLKVIGMYTVAGGGGLWLLAVVFLYALEQGTKIWTDTWLGLWITDAFDKSLGFYLGLYFAFAVAFAVATYVRSITFVFGAVRAAVSLHNQLLEKIVCLPISFFDTNPSGRIINRFSRDTEIMDAVLPPSLIQLSACIASYIGILIVISYVTPWFLLMLPPITILYFALQRFYIPAGREMQRLEAVTRSPIYSGFSEAVNGITTIRAFGREAHFIRLEDRLIENNGMVYLLQRAGSAWLSIRLDVLGLVVLTAAGLLAVNGQVSPNLAGLSLTYALDLTKFLKFGARMASKAESDFNSVERVLQYLQVEPEAPAELPKDPSSKEWPSEGAITVNKAVMRYRPTLPTVLKSVSFEVTGGAHIGIVGRTGSGKSSLFLAFFRIVELELGSISIDGRNIADLGLATLRRGLSMIPQDPFMFSGTVRRNLDPFDQFGDSEVWQALERVSLKPLITAMDDKLESLVSDNGGNFSQGQRQLFCLARALLRNSKVLMMDEATASVDLDTDALIQTVVRESFSHCTVLTIAHRLNTIMDSGKVLVMDAGVAAEFDTPHHLLQDPESIFSGLVNNTGAKSAAMLRNVASRSHQQLQLLAAPDSQERAPDEVETAEIASSPLSLPQPPTLHAASDKSSSPSHDTQPGGAAAGVEAEDGDQVNIISHV